MRRRETDRHGDMGEWALQTLQLGRLKAGRAHVELLGGNRAGTGNRRDELKT